MALLIYLTALFASGPALLGVIPTPASISYLAALLQDGWQEVFQYATPVPVLPGIELMSTGGIGLIAFLVDLLAVRLRRAAPGRAPPARDVRPAGEVPPGERGVAGLPARRGRIAWRSS